MQRQIDNVESNKNHAAVLIWSLGNEAGNGPNFDHRRQGRPVARPHPARPLRGSRAIRTDGDMDSQMYTKP